jgi:hypothetical protein
MNIYIYVYAYIRAPVVHLLLALEAFKVLVYEA